MIHEAGALAVAKKHGRGPHRINEGRRTVHLLDIPRVWAAAEALAKYIEDSGDGFCLEASGTIFDGGKDSEALKLIIDKLIGDAEPTPSVLQ